MALIHTKQINPKWTGSFTLSGSFIGDAESTASFGSLRVNDLDFTTAVSTSAASTGFAATAGVASSVNFDGNRRVLQKKFPLLLGQILRQLNYVQPHELRSVLGSTFRS